jgi:integrase
MPVITLTTTFIKSELYCPENKQRIEFCCDEVKGFFIEVRQASPEQGTYYLRYKNTQKKTSTEKIGNSRDISLKDARDRAKLMKNELQQGKDPKEEKLKQRAIPTFNVFFKQRYIPYAREHKRTWKNDQQMFDTHLDKLFGELRLHVISRAAVQKFHTGLKQRGLSGATCDHYIKLMRHVLNLAVDWEVIDNNQLTRLKLFREDNQTERYLSDDELTRLLEVLRTGKNRNVCNIAMFLLSTGARCNEALTAKWQNIDIANRVWRVPADISKSKKVRAIPLSDTAINVLTRAGTQGEFDYVFVNRKTNLPYQCIKKGWTTIRKEAGLPNLRLHDLRHQYASILVNSGRSLYEVQKILGHSDPKVTQRYAHLNTQRLREAVDATSTVFAAAENRGRNSPHSPKTVLRLAHSR